MTINQKLDNNKTKILDALYPGLEASKIANTKQTKRVVKWLIKNRILLLKYG